jgi:hypothetical protein
MEPWTPTPEDQRHVMQRLRDGEWQPCEMKDLVRGDVFRVFHPQTGKRMDPVTNEETEENIVGHCVTDAMRNYQTNQGYAVECEVEREPGFN